MCCWGGGGRHCLASCALPLLPLLLHSAHHKDSNVYNDFRQLEWPDLIFLPTYLPTYQNTCKYKAEYKVKPKDGEIESGRLIFQSAWKLLINRFKGWRCCTLVTFKKLWIRHLDLNLKFHSSSSCETYHCSVEGRFPMLLPRQSIWIHIWGGLGGKTRNKRSGWTFMMKKPLKLGQTFQLG